MGCYASMVRGYMIPTKSKHYTCIINCLGHVGHLQNIENMIKLMPYTFHAVHG